jgi:DNA ligase (NAD+)
MGTNLNTSGKLNKKEAGKKIAELRSQLHQHNHSYYNLAESVISDKDFDMLLNELEGLEKLFPEFDDDLSPTKRPGGDPVDGFER